LLVLSVLLQIRELGLSGVVRLGLASVKMSIGGGRDTPGAKAPHFSDSD